MIVQYITLLVIHFIGDFVCQTHWQASNKSKNNIALSKHVLSYAVVLYAGSFIIFDWYVATAFTLINGILHFTTDYITSRLTSYLWAKQRIHDFFVIIGFDQLIHQLCLAGTLIIFIQ